MSRRREGRRDSYSAAAMLAAMLAAMKRAKGLGAALSRRLREDAAFELSKIHTGGGHG